MFDNMPLTRRLVVGWVLHSGGRRARATVCVQDIERVGDFDVAKEQLRLDALASDGFQEGDLVAAGWLLA